MCTDMCGWLHKELFRLPEIKDPFDLERLPSTGIYFFYENGEIGKGHDDSPRIVRIGTAKAGNFKNRIASHFLLDIEKMKFTVDQPKPADFSIFRKNIGRALLNRDKCEYQTLWDVDFILRKNREQYKECRDVRKEIEIEQQVTDLFRNTLSFRYLVLSEQPFRMEAKLISTVSQCRLCSPSTDWLGNYSTKPNIQASGLWQEQHLKGRNFEKEDLPLLENLFMNTIKFQDKN